MISFDPLDLFPLLDTNYAEAQEHARNVDSYLGLQIDSVESRFEKPKEDVQYWIGLPAQALLTPYTEIRQILKEVNPQPNQHIVDLGAGYGRMAFVIGRHYPEVRFTGYEVVAERVQEAKRCLDQFSYSNVQMLQQDLVEKNFQLPEADIFFLYDFGSRTAIEKIMEDLKTLAKKKSVTVIGRGRLSRDTIERSHPWLSQVREPKHFAHFSIYRC